MSTERSVIHISSAIENSSDRKLRYTQKSSTPADISDTDSRGQRDISTEQPLPLPFMPISTFPVPAFCPSPDEEVPVYTSHSRAPSTSPGPGDEMEARESSPERSIVDSSSESSQESIKVSFAPKTLIPKPIGEVGRRVGGYNLQDTLDWGGKEFESIAVRAFPVCLERLILYVQAEVHNLVTERLDERQSWKPQDRSEVAKIRKEVRPWGLPY